jgi:hypothetical protein
MGLSRELKNRILFVDISRTHFEGLTLSLLFDYVRVSADGFFSAFFKHLVYGCMLWTLRKYRQHLKTVDVKIV